MASQYNSTYSIHRQYRRYQIGKKKKLLLLPIISFVNSTVIIRAPLIVLQYRVCLGEDLKKDWRGVSQPLNLPVSRDSVTIFLILFCGNICEIMDSALCYPLRFSQHYVSKRKWAKLNSEKKMVSFACCVISAKCFYNSNIV